MCKQLIAPLILSLLHHTAQGCVDVYPYTQTRNCRYEHRKVEVDGASVCVCVCVCVCRCDV
jgi:hypothetical protein